jgi:hypothetical protein
LIPIRSGLEKGDAPLKVLSSLQLIAPTKCPFRKI